MNANGSSWFLQGAGRGRGIAWDSMVDEARATRGARSQHDAMMILVEDRLARGIIDEVDAAMMRAYIDGRPAAEIATAGAVAIATKRGASRGRSAAEWFAQDAFGGRVTRGADDAARAILDGIESGDPAILDGFPSADLSGQWADELTGPILVRESFDEVEFNEAPEFAFNEVCDAYEFAFNDAASAEIERLARSAVAS